MPLGQAQVPTKDVVDLLRILQSQLSPNQTPKIPSSDSLGGDSFGTSARP